MIFCIYKIREASGFIMKNESKMREEQKKEALERMKILGLLSPMVIGFEKRDSVWMNDGNSIAALNAIIVTDQYKEAIDKFEAEHGELVYYAFYDKTAVGNLLALLYVSKNPEEWEADREDLKEGCPLAYVVNMTEPIFSEYGSIGVKVENGMAYRYC
jgi:hypothetical protein